MHTESGMRMEPIRQRRDWRESLSDPDFARLSRFIESECGIKMPSSKRVLLESRLQKRLRETGFGSFTAYLDFLFSQPGAEEELVHMIDVITTNKTDFFREDGHFTYLVNQALPELLKREQAGRSLEVWSAGCSTGEEPYTLAMVLRHFQEHNPGFRFEILGTDISSRVLKQARLAVYDQERTSPVPEEMKKKYLLRSRDKNGRVRITPDLRMLVQFRRLNLMEPDFGMRHSFDIIFCRNVMIYFDRPTQEQILIHMIRHLRPGGYLFLGHSETLHGFELPLTLMASTAYRLEGRKGQH